MAAGGDHRRRGRVGAADVLERREHPVGHEHGRADPPEHVNLLAGGGGRPDNVLDAESSRDLGRHHDVRMVGEPVRPADHGHARRDQRGRHQAAILAPGQAQLDRLSGLHQVGDGGDERLGHRARPAVDATAEGTGDGRWPRSRLG